ncbi:SCO family protein [Roseateles sp. BYS180W]|uniref:SCO family protein n=1 Tax=Roseateles rivi TaxID=3299028 RepID=A0ABW7FRU4_9BURK
MSSCPAEPPGRARPSAWPTLCASALILGAGLWAAHSVTQGWRSWTSEDARRNQAAATGLALPDMPLLLEDGSPAQLHALLRQGPTVLMLIYTRCNSVCRVGGSDFALLQSQLQAASPTAIGGSAAPPTRLRLLQLSFDTQADRPAALRAWAQQQRADPKHWRVGVPQNSADAQALLRTLQVQVLPDGQGGYEHDAAFLMVDTQARVRRVLDLSAVADALAWGRWLQP